MFTWAFRKRRVITALRLLTRWSLQRRKWESWCRAQEESCMTCHWLDGQCGHFLSGLSGAHLARSAAESRRSLAGPGQCGLVTGCARLGGWSNQSPSIEVASHASTNCSVSCALLFRAFLSSSAFEFREVASNLSWSVGRSREKVGFFMVLSYRLISRSRSDELMRKNVSTRLGRWNDGKLIGKGPISQSARLACQSRLWVLASYTSVENSHKAVPK